MIVSVAADIGMVDVVKMALSQPDEYAARLTAHHAEVSAFGGMFLLLVFLNYFLTTKNKPIGFTGWKAGWASWGGLTPSACWWRC